MRLFVALAIDEDIRRRLAEFRNQMRALAPDVRWVSPDTFHVTLQFLGETEKADEIRRALQSVSSSAIPLKFSGTGFFPNPRSPRVFWAGIEADQRLQQLVDRVGTALDPVGFVHDSGPHTPHLTLARSGSGRPCPVRGEQPAAGLISVRHRLETLASPDFGTMTAREFCLYRSELSPSGAKYTVLERYPLE